MQTILVSVDRSGVADRAATVAADLAAAFGARLVAVSVTDGAASQGGPLQDGAIPAVQRRLRSLGRELGIDVDVRSSHGRAGDELVRHIREVAADLVVIAAPESPEGSVGSVVEQVLSACGVPVLVVPPPG
jgi:nucleotide-binding universal stress UspA family protein